MVGEMVLSQEGQTQIHQSTCPVGQSAVLSYGTWLEETLIEDLTGKTKLFKTELFERTVQQPNLHQSITTTTNFICQKET